MTESIQHTYCYFLFFTIFISMKNLPNYFKVFIFFLLTIPFGAILFDYCWVISLYGNGYFNYRTNLVSAYFEDSIYLFIVQLIPRAIMILLSMIISELIATFTIVNRKISSILIGLLGGVLLCYFDVNLFIGNGLHCLETIIFYTFIGFSYPIVRFFFIPQ
jgi:hypothetical protein